MPSVPHGPAVSTSTTMLAWNVIYHAGGLANAFLLMGQPAKHQLPWHCCLEGYLIVSSTGFPLGHPHQEGTLWGAEVMVELGQELATLSTLVL